MNSVPAFSSIETRPARVCLNLRSKLSLGLTRTELVVAVSISAILIVLAAPFLSDYMLEQRLVGSISGARMLYIASLSMATDYGTTKDVRLGWPGDLAEREREPVTTVTAYLNRLMEFQYLQRVDLEVVLKKAGGRRWDADQPLDATRHCPFKIYRVKEADSANVLFCATRNFTYNIGLDPDVRPYGDKGFMVFRKGGDGGVFIGKRNAGDTMRHSLGMLPGRADFDTRATESAEDYLAF
jgi:type II secretory pathway pseudopilin PulG